MRLALLALAALVWIAVPVSARAETDVWDGMTASEFAGGTGEENDPYQISTAAQLAYLAQKVNAGEAYRYKYIVLTADIDLANKEWTPIGIYRNSFQGNFDGRNHTVTRMRISNSSMDYGGLFGECRRHNINSAIKNITVKNSDINGKRFVGAIVGRAEGINIENCRSIANTINSEKNVGGICGYFGGNPGGKVSQCYNSSKVTGDDSAGGIAGIGDRCTAENCLNTGEIKVTTRQDESTGGGIFGFFNDSIASASITACVNLGKVSGGASFGGIVGRTDSKSTGHISNCYYNMDVITGGFDAGTALTAGQLCGALPEGLDSTIWEEGSVDTSIAKATDTGSRFGTATGTYINLTKVAKIGETKTASVPVYNYVTTNGDDWDIYTLITTAEEFAAIGQDTTKWSANYVLANDIDVSGVQLSSIGDPGTLYTGKFSGDGHTISHINLKKGNGYGSLFGYVKDKVMLLAVNGEIDLGNNDAGGICGNLSYGEIYGCSFIGTVKGATVGGICAHVGSGKISQCFFAGDLQGRNATAGICGMGGNVGGINYCISIATIDITENDGNLAGITNSRDYGVTNCYFNNDICNVEDTYKLGCTTLQLTSSSFFKKLKDNGFDTAIWTKKANDKETGIAYYPSLGENNAVPVKYTTGLSFEITDDSTLTYGEKITFNAKALVNFATDGQTISAEDTEGSFEIRIGDTPVVSAADFKNGIATYRAQTAGETTFTLVYTGTNSSFFPEQTTKDLTVNINPAPLTVGGEGIAGGTYGNKLRELKVTGLSAKLESETIDGTWQIIGDEVPYVGDDGTYTATFTPAQHPEYYQPLTASVKLAIEKAEVSAIPMQNLYYSWAAKGEKEVQIPGLPEDRGTTELISTVKSDDAKVLATDQAIRYSEGKLIFTLGENTMEDITHSATIQIVLGSQNYKDICVDITIHRTAKADREDTPDPDAFDMTFTVSGNDLAAQITTDRTDVEFSFDGTDWGQTKSTGVGHNEKVTARIRYAETDDYNASPAVSKTWNSGHGPLNRHDRVEPTCQAEGSIEYWTCDVCGLYFASADGSKSITATEIVLPKTDHSWAEGYLSDMTGHWHKCGVCGITSNTEKHASGGAATTERAEICTICGYEIAPKKPAASNDDDSSQASNTDRKATDAAAPPVATATPATPGVVKPSVIPVPPTTPAADENRKEDAAKPSGEAQDTQESSGEAPQEERIDSMTAQTSGSQESGTEQITETSGKGTNAGRVAAAAAAGAVVVGGGGAAVYVTMIKGKFKFK